MEQANGQELKITTMGTWNIKTVDQDGGAITISIPNTLVIPDLEQTLIAPWDLLNWVTRWILIKIIQNW